MTPEQIRQIRQRLGLSQVEVSRLMDVDPVTWNRWESGHQPPRFPGMLSLALHDLERTRGMITDSPPADDTIEYPPQFARQEYNVTRLERRPGTSVYTSEKDSVGNTLEFWLNHLTLDGQLRRAWVVHLLVPETDGYTVVLKAI